MLSVDGVVHLSASDLVGHLNCDYLTALDLAVARGELDKPSVWDPVLEVLVERGAYRRGARLRAEIPAPSGGLRQDASDGRRCKDGASGNEFREIPLSEPILRRLPNRLCEDNARGPFPSLHLIALASDEDLMSKRETGMTEGFWQSEAH